MSSIVRVLAPLGLEEELDAMPLAAAARCLFPAHQVEALAFGPEANVDAHVAAFAHALRAEPPAALTLLPAGAEEIAARVAMRLDGVALGRCTRIELTSDGVVAERDAFGGRARATLRAPFNAFATLRAATLVAPAQANLVAPAQANLVAPAQANLVAPAKAGAQFRLIPPHTPLPPPPVTRRREIAAGRQRLEGARVVVSGGRGMAGPEGFAQLEALASCLDAAVGGSLPTVDAGWVPVACQVGQSGKFVTPEVYVAVAISGTPQHLAGIGPDTRIVAINKDPAADIFRVAEAGVVGDWREIVPALVERLNSPSPLGEGRIGTRPSPGRRAFPEGRGEGQ